MEIYELIKQYINPELLLLVPVLYIVGAGIKRSQIKDKFIPLILGVVGVTLSTLYVAGSGVNPGISSALLALFTGITQGILVAGASVYINQSIKQLTSNEEIEK